MRVCVADGVLVGASVGVSVSVIVGVSVSVDVGNGVKLAVGEGGTNPVSVTVGVLVSDGIGV